MDKELNYMAEHFHFGGKMIYFDENLVKAVKPYLNYPASDIVRIDHQTDMELYQSLINEDLGSSVYTPSDIVFANTIPLKDIEIQIDERSTDFSFGKGKLVRYRVILFDNLSNIDNASKPTSIGYLVLYIPDSKKPAIIFSLAVQKGNNYIFPLSAYSMVNIPLVLNIFTNTWYAIQISLLHPKIKTLFDNPTKVPLHNNNISPNRVRKVKYIKIHKIRIKDVKDITHEPGERNRKCLVWYVIGHWRKYKTGKEIFIQGYWKGQLRDIKKNLDNRERIITVEEEEIKRG